MKKIGIGKWFCHDICRKHVPDDDHTFKRVIDLMPCIKDKSPEEVLEVVKSYLIMEDIKRLIVRKDGKEVVYIKQVKDEPSVQPERKKGE